MLHPVEIVAVVHVGQPVVAIDPVEPFVGRDGLDPASLDWPRLVERVEPGLAAPFWRHRVVIAVGQPCELGLVAHGGLDLASLDWPRLVERVEPGLAVPFWWHRVVIAAELPYEPAPVAHVGPDLVVAPAGFDPVVHVGRYPWQLAAEPFSQRLAETVEQLGGRGPAELALLPAHVVESTECFAYASCRLCSANQRYGQFAAVAVELVARFPAAAFCEPVPVENGEHFLAVFAPAVLEPAPVVEPACGRCHGLFVASPVVAAWPVVFGPATPFPVEHCVSAGCDDPVETCSVYSDLDLIRPTSGIRIESPFADAVLHRRQLDVTFLSPCEPVPVDDLSTPNRCGFVFGSRAFLKLCFAGKVPAAVAHAEPLQAAQPFGVCHAILARRLSDAFSFSAGDFRDVLLPTFPDVGLRVFSGP